MQDDPDSWLAYLRDPAPWRAPDPRPEGAETERALVRLYRFGDGPALFEAINASRDAILPWMTWASTDHQRVEHSIHYVERVRRAAARGDACDFPMGIFERRSGRLLGATGLHDIRPMLRQAEVGYWIRRDATGRGLCTEAIGALMGAALTPSSAGGWGLRRLIVYVATENVASRRVCEKLGLRLEGHMRAERYLGYPPDAAPGYHDTYLFAVLADEWDHDAGRAKPGIGWD